MSLVSVLWEKLAANPDRGLLFWRGREYTCGEILERARAWETRLATENVREGAVCGYRGEYSPEVCALILALMKARAILVPFTRGVDSEIEGLMRIAAVSTLIDFDDEDGSTFRAGPGGEIHPLLAQLRESGHAGIVVFSSGSTGEPKGIVHDCERVLGKFSLPRPGYRTLQFLLLDHFGGINTLFSVCSNGGVVVVAGDRTPAAVAKLVAEARVELLPVTPTFLNLMLASGSHRAHDMSSVKLITYGTEVMPEATLARVHEAFPNARLLQTYGLSEVGVLRSQSRGSDSLWVKVGGQGFETRVVDGLLHVRSESAMLGYLNAPSPFDADGWMNTSDAVIQDGEWLRILGRTSDIINVGGQKVFPAEVESVLMQCENVVDAAVMGEKHALMGTVVVARLTLEHPESAVALRQRLRKACLERLAAHKVPVRFYEAKGVQHTDRFKKTRTEDGK